MYEDSFINDKIDYVENSCSIKLLPLIPEIPSCYMYVVLYSLSNMNHLVCTLINNEKYQSNYVVSWLRDCVKYLLNFDMNEDFIKNYNLKNFIKSVKDCQPIEDDAMAFTEVLFETLNEITDIKNVYKTKWNVNYECKNCEEKTQAPNDIWSIWRISTNNIKDANFMNNFFESTNTLTNFKCDKCKCLTDANILYSIQDLPLCLLIQIERVNFVNGNFLKSDNYVSFDETIMVQNRVYQLKSIVLHFGSNSYDGHYLVCIKKKLRDTQQLVWFIIDGTNYYYIMNINEENIHKNAVLLFYSRIS